MQISLTLSKGVSKPAIVKLLQMLKRAPQTEKMVCGTTKVTAKKGKVRESIAKDAKMMSIILLDRRMLKFSYLYTNSSFLAPILRHLVMHRINFKREESLDRSEGVIQREKPMTISRQHSNFRRLLIAMTARAKQVLMKIWLRSFHLLVSWSRSCHTKKREQLPPKVRSQKEHPGLTL